MGSWSDTSSDGKARVRSANYRVRFRHGVYPNAEGEATRADIKKYDYFFGNGQTWVTTPGEVDFVDETAQVTADVGTVDHGKLGESTSRRPSRKLSRSRTAERVLQASPRAIPMRVSMGGFQPALNTSAPAFMRTAPSTASNSPQHVVFPHHRHASPAASSISSLDGSSSVEWQHDGPTSAASFQPAPTSWVSWPLSDPIEAQLFRFYVDTASTSWDITSPTGIFKNVVPRLALTNSMLLNSIFMFAASNIRRFDPSFPAKPYMYHARVLQELIPYLAENGRIQDEATLVAAMFLRGFEEHHAGTRGQYHLSTYELFHGPEGWLFDMSSPVVQSCFMVHVHFEIYQALLNQPSLRVDYRSYALPALSRPLDDITWGNRITWISARILQWANTEVPTLAEWHGLKDMVDEWERERPSTFDAFFYREADPSEERHFQDLWFPNYCHADAYQHLRICRIVLAMNYYEPGCSRLREKEIESCKAVQLAKWLIEMVAVARSNPHVTTTSFIAAHTMHKFAVGLQNQVDKNHVMEFLEEVEGLGWTTESTRRWLRAEWGWQMQDIAEHSINERM